ncbi:MAG: serine/threonine-protein kinase [Verrucomicrobiales bacterium]
MTPPDADDKLTADELAGMARALAPGSSGSRQQARWFDAEALAAQLAAAVPGYDAVAPLGHGGMGAVFKARRIADGRAVAIKVLLPGLSADEGFRERFRREAAAMIELDHPNIVSVFESGEAGDLCFLVMEYVGGAPLRDRLAGGPLPAGEAHRIAADLCAALQSAHDRGVLHRDIKPGNILLAEDGTVKLADFGLAKLVGARAEADRDYTLTLTDAALGTPAYMAPEQLRGAASIDQRADLYSLGAVLYEMLAGAPPVGDFEPPSTLAAADPEARRLDAAVLRALRNRPSDRFASASAMAAELARAAHASQPGRRRAWQIAALAAPALGATAWEPPHLPVRPHR